GRTAWRPPRELCPTAVSGRSVGRHAPPEALAVVGHGLDALVAEVRLAASALGRSMAWEQRVVPGDSRLVRSETLLVAGALVRRRRRVPRRRPPPLHAGQPASA